jgi:AraC-like DNA-binding protein
MRQWMTQAAEEWLPPDAGTNRVGWSLRGGGASRRISDGLGMALWGLCERIAQEDAGRPTGADAPVPEWFVSLLEQIEQNPGVQLSALAQTAFVSPSHLRRAFHSWTGMSPQEYRTRCRLNAARVLLVETEQTVAHIAVNVGFDSPFHFSRLFKRRFGVSPVRYRGIARSPVF